jgi:hypothetical protein
VVLQSPVFILLVMCMNEMEKREKRLENFSEEIKDYSEEKLLLMRQGENAGVYESKRRVGLIDQEFSRRKPFYSMHDEMVDESTRCSDTSRCAFYGCDKPSEYYSVIGVRNEKYGVFACREHTSSLYEPMHRCLGNVDIVKLVKEK